MIAYQVCLFQMSKYIDNLYTYISDKEYSVGDIVAVPFGRGNKIYDSIIIKITDYDKIKNKEKLKEIVRKNHDQFSLTIGQIDFALWIREKYLCSYYEAIKLFLPPSNFSKKSINYKTYYKVINIPKLQNLKNNLKKNATNKISIYETLINFKEISEDHLKEITGTYVKKYMKELENENIIISKNEIDYPEININQKNEPKVKQNGDQKLALNKIKDIYENHKNKSILLHGVTGSGKTLIYLEFIEYLLKKNKNAIVLVPEISLTYQTINKFSERFGDKIAIIHSNLTSRERFDQYIKIKSGKVNIVIGARSALFAPMENLGAIIIDECHDYAYLSEMSPKYSAIEAGEKLAKDMGASLILSSATPTIKQYYFAKNDRYHLITLDKRANGLPLPEVISIDMLKELKSGNKLDISKRLQIEINKEIKLNNQVILFLNRRGYSNHLTCDNCGYVPTCKNCDITLTYHISTRTFKCHYCNYEIPFYRTCPECSEGTLIDMGSGTQKIERQIANLFPDANIFRMDKDTTSKRGMHSIILENFKETPASILIGTQMIGKGHDFPRVTLVGIINQDQGMNSPDYAALERSYNMIEQVGGRAGRDLIEGKVILQTYSPNNKLSYFIQNHDYVGFYNYEIKNREIFKYEPFGNIIRIIISSENDKAAKNSCKKVQDGLNFYNKTQLNNKLKIFNMVECSVHKLENKYRYQILMRVTNDSLTRCKKMIHFLLTNKRSVVLDSKAMSQVDINPTNMI